MDLDKVIAQVGSGATEYRVMTNNDLRLAPWLGNEARRELDKLYGFMPTTGLSVCWVKSQ
jgi:hypothetical protein